ncbi:MAG: Cys-Gln thioester bond-forming surface protein [Bacilli bacterium]|nr:Cys-Gln thioester bond-forming surface protein [Bacilli bacterium]
MKKILLFLLVVFSVFIPNVYANTEGYETTKEEIKEDNDLDQPDITVDLVNGEVTSSEVSDTTTTGDVKEDENDLDYDYTETTVIEREIEATTSDEKVVISESNSELEGVNPIKDSTKEELYLNNYTDPSGITITDDGPNGYEYKYVGSGDYSAQWISKVYVTFEKDEDDNPLIDEDGNYIIKSLTKSDGTIITSNGVPTTDVNAVFDQKTGTRGQQFLLMDKDGNAVYGYCIDLGTGANKGYWYTIANLEDNDYYASEESEKHVRSIVMNGYWGTLSDADNDGNFDIGSLALIKQKLKEALVKGEIDGEVTVSYRVNGEIITEVITITDDVIDNLTEGEALDMTQAAIWSYANGAQSVQDGEDGWIVAGTMYGDMANGNRSGKDDPEGMARMTVLYKWLMDLEEEHTSSVIINEKNYVEDLSLTVGNRVKDDIYEASINFDLVYDIVDEDDLIVYLSYKDDNDEEQTIVRRIVGTLKENEEYIKENENGYVIDGLNLKNNTDFTFTLRLAGEQNLKFGAYIYTAAGGIDSSQTFVGLAKGNHKVDISSEITISFDVDDNNKVITEHMWNSDINGDISDGGIGNEMEPPHTGTTCVEFILYNNVAIIDKKRELLNI